MNLSKAIDLFQSQQKPSTRKSYHYVLQDMANFVGPSRDLSEVKPEHFAEFSMSLEKRNYAIATKVKTVKTIKTFFNWCIRNQLLDISPARILKAPRMERFIERSKAMPDDDLDAIITVAKTKGRDYALLLFLADTGCRAGGAAGLKVEDLNIKSRTAKVTEKGNRTRDVKYGEDCAKAINTWLIARKNKNCRWVFTARGLKPLSADAVSQIINRLAHQALGRPWGSHSLRHRKGHQLADSKVAPSVAATALGHSDVTITMQNYYPADWERAEKALDDLSYKEESRPAQRSKIIRLGG